MFSFQSYSPHISFTFFRIYMCALYELKVPTHNNVRLYTTVQSSIEETVKVFDLEEPIIEFVPYEPDGCSQVESHLFQLRQNITGYVDFDLLERVELEKIPKDYSYIDTWFVLNKASSPELMAIGYSMSENADRSLTMKVLLMMESDPEWHYRIKGGEAQHHTILKEIFKQLQERAKLDDSGVRVSYCMMPHGKEYEDHFWEEEYDCMDERVLEFYRMYCDPYLINLIKHYQEVIDRPLLVVDISCGRGHLACKLLRSPINLKELILTEKSKDLFDNAVENITMSLSLHKSECHVHLGNMDAMYSYALFDYLDYLTSTQHLVDVWISEGSMLSARIDNPQCQFITLTRCLDILSDKGVFIHIGCENFFMDKHDFVRYFPHYEMIHYTTHIKHPNESMKFVNKYACIICRKAQSEVVIRTVVQAGGRLKLSYRKWKDAYLGARDKHRTSDILSGTSV